MPTSDALATFLDRKLTTREWSTIVVTRGESFQINAFTPVELRGLSRADLAIEILDHAHNDAMGTRSAGPYFVWLHLLDEKGDPVHPVRFTLTFEDCVPTEAHERSSLLFTQRELAINQTHALNEAQRLVLEAGKMMGMRHEAEVERARSDLAAERQHAIVMAELLFKTSQATVAGAHAASEALVQGDVRRKQMLAEARNQQMLAALMGNLDVILPMVASGWMKHNGKGNEPLGQYAEYNLVTAFLQSLRDDQYATLGSLFPPHLRQGIIDIYQGKIAGPLIPTAAAKIFAQVDEKLALAIYEKLDPAVADSSKPALPATDAEGKPILDENGNAVLRQHMTQSDQQRMFAQLWATKDNTWAARGEAMTKAGIGM